MSSRDFKGTYLVMIPLEGLGTETFDFSVRNINQEDIYSDPEINKGRSYELEPHISVLLGLKEDHLDVLRRVVEDYHPFSISLSKFDYFQTSKVFKDGVYREYDVLYQSVVSGDLLDFHKRLSESTGVVWHFPEYKTHVTYAYLKYGTAREYADRFNKSSKVNREFEVSNVLFKKFQDSSFFPRVMTLGNVTDH